jgi:hypothetical protein
MSTEGATIWHDAMAPILTTRGSGEFPPADPVVEVGNTRSVPWCTTVAGCRAALADAGFEHATVEVDSDHEAGVVSELSPPRGGRGVPGQLVTILVSNGSEYVPPPPPPPAPTTAPPSPTTPRPDPEPEPDPDPPPDTDPDRAPDPDVDPEPPGP